MHQESDDSSSTKQPVIINGPSLVLDQNHVFSELYYKKARYKIYWGGRGAAKSWAIAEALIRLTAALPLRVLCVREFQNSMKDSSIKVLADTITRLGLDSWFVVTADSIKSRVGAEFIFKGCHNNTNGIRSTEGIDILWAEEAHSISELSWRVLLPTIRKEGSEIWISFNMDDEADATYRRFVATPRSDSIIHKVNYDSNPYLSVVLRQEMEDDKAADYQLYEHIWLGMARKVSNAIILSGKYRVAEFDEDMWKSTSRLRFGADFGFAQDPNTLLRSFIMEGKNPDTNRPTKSLYISGEAWGQGVDLDDMPDFYDAVKGCRDWPIKADSARPETISHLRRKGFNISAAAKWDGSVKDGIAHLRGYNEIVIAPTCPKTAAEAHAWRYKVDPKIVDAQGQPQVLPIVVDKHNHCISGDALITTDRGLIRMDEIKAGHMVMTRAGFKRVLWAGMTDTDRDVIKVTTKAGLNLVCTPDHEVFVNGVFVQADAIRYNDEVITTGSVSCPPSESSDTSKDWPTGLTPRLAITETMPLANGSTSQSTRISMALSSRAMKCITRITTKATMQLATWSPLRAKSIRPNTLTRDYQSSASVLPKQLRQQKNGMLVRQVWNGIGAMRKQLASGSIKQLTSSASAVESPLLTAAHPNEDMPAQDTVSSNSGTNPELMTLNALAHNAGSPSKSTSINQGSFAVDHVLCVTAMPAKEAKVYDITVEDQHEFFANGILVHNCWDAIRYGLDGEIQRTGSIGMWERLGEAVTSQ